jgi:hypothetical protein
MNWIAKSVIAVLLAASALLVGAGSAAALPGVEVRELIEGLEVGEPVYYENLTIIPVYAVSIRDRTRYTTLDEAIEEGYLDITEVEGGRVPQVMMGNRSDRCIFVMGGEILIGCRQDRIVGRDVLLRPRASGVIVPVYCVEQGRWTYESERFSSRANLGTSRLRAESQKASGDAQTKIWGYVSGMADRAGVTSPTSRFQEAYESDRIRRRIFEAEKRMGDIPRLCPDAIGAVIGVGDRITSADVFLNPHLFGEEWSKILRSSALAAACEPAYGSLSQTDAIGFLRRLHDSAYVARPAVDLGFEISAADRGVNANALVNGTAVIHLAGFPEEGACRDGAIPQDSDRRIPVIRR